jgi:hypothetical protein
MKSRINTLLSALAVLALLPTGGQASSHMDAPLITLDPAANTTDVYAFVSQRATTKYLTVALAVYPHEEPGVGPNKYNFDDRVLYRLKVGTGIYQPTAKNPNPKAEPTTFEFRFRTVYKNKDTIAQSYLGVVNAVDDGNQNLTQHYTVSKIVAGKATVLFADALVPPNNQGLLTPFYNQSDSGENLAKEGVALEASLDTYTSAAIFTNPAGYQVFAGQRDDGFYADIQSIFDLDFSFGGGNKPFDSQGGFNVHTIVLNIPLTELGGDQQVASVWAETLRRSTTVLHKTPTDNLGGTWIQVGRQGNPLFCEALVAVQDKDSYNRSPVGEDALRYTKYAKNPELAGLLGAPSNRRVNRTDLVGIFIPDVIRVDLSTAPARLAGGSASGAAAPDAGFHRLGIFGGDTLTSTIQVGFGGGTVPGGWPNGRRFGDDVLDIGVIAVLSDLRVSPPLIFGDANTDIDRVKANDIGYNKVFPYAATPHNGRHHSHD